jgi:hypothetical protein
MKHIKEFIEWQDMKTAPTGEEILVKGVARCGMVDIVAGKINVKGEFDSRHVNKLKPIEWLRIMTNQASMKIKNNMHIEEREPEYIIVVQNDHPQD